MIAVLFCALFVQFVQAQNYAIVHVESDESGLFNYCSDEYDGVIFYAQPGCTYFDWYVDGINYHNVDHVIIDNQGYHSVSYGGCGLQRSYDIENHSSIITNPFTESIIWKSPSDTIRLSIPEDYDFDLEWVWSNGSNDYGIDVVNDSIYSITFTSIYGCELEQSTFSVEVRNNVEIYRAGVDPATNKNRVLWQTTPEQAQYVSSVKVERDGMVVGTVPYLDGQFLDNIGSENAARIYRITAIASDGTECPLPSYQFGTFNTIISPDIANPNLMNFSWEDPFIEEGSPYSVVAYRIGRFNENTGEFVAIDQLSANVHLGKYNMDLFDGDYGIVAAVFNDAKRDNEELAFSNRSDNEIVGVGENEASSFSVYPNPSNGIFTVEGASTLTIYNMMGQVIATSFDENGVHTISIKTPGVYFIKSDDEGTKKRVVIE
jgi:hypothetical protein